MRVVSAVDLDAAVPIELHASILANAVFLPLIGHQESILQAVKRIGPKGSWQGNFVTMHSDDVTDRPEIKWPLVCNLILSRVLPLSENRRVTAMRFEDFREWSQKSWDQSVQKGTQLRHIDLRSRQ